jgi:hypothetical protein
MVKYSKADFKDGKVVETMTTMITPRPPYFLFVPAIHEMPVEEIRENKGKSAFAFGHFVKSTNEAMKEAKKNGYKKKDIKLLEQQGYLVSKERLKLVA